MHDDEIFGARDNVNQVQVQVRRDGVIRVRPCSSPDEGTVEPARKLARPGVIVPWRSTWEGAVQIRFSIVLAPTDPHIAADRFELSLTANEERQVRINAIDDQAPLEVDEVRYALGADPEAPVRLHRTVDGHFPPTHDLVFAIQGVDIPGIAAEDDDVASPEYPAPFFADWVAGREGAIFGARLPREIWLRLGNIDNDGGNTYGRDVALFTIAPFIFSCDLDRPLHLFIKYGAPSGAAGRSEMDFKTFTSTYLPGSWGAGNYPAIYTMWRECTGRAIPFTVSSAPNKWVQDCQLIGYTHTPTAGHAVLLHVIRSGKGQPMIVPPALVDGIRVCYSDDQRLVAGSSSLDFGGNVIATPPVAMETDALDEGNAGPAVRAHPAAPYGKIIYCDNGGTRRPSQLVRDFLGRQLVQPLVPIDVSGLDVGHADEVVSFVRHAGSQQWSMLFAAPDVAWTLIERASAYPLYRGPGNGRFEPGVPEFRADLVNFPPGYAANVVDRVLDCAGVPFFRKLADIQTRLQHVLGDLPDERVIRVPVPFAPAGRDSCLPNMVNLQVLDTLVFVPKPWGPRLATADVRTLLEGVEGLTRQDVYRANLGELEREEVWFSTDHPFSVFDATAGLRDPELPAEVALPGPFPTIDGVANVGPPNMACWRFDHRSVCVFEAYMRCKLAQRGLTPVFVDTWDFYNTEHGQIHCGTNVLRHPPEIDADDYWWLNYDRWIPR